MIRKIVFYSDEIEIVNEWLQFQFRGLLLFQTDNF